MFPEFRHAIVGCGRVAPSHVDAFRHVDGVVLSHAVDIDPERAAAFAVEHGIGQATSCYADVLADPTVTSVSLCSPHDTHAPLAQQALEAGKHVLVEKPFVLFPADGERLQATASRLGLVLMPVVQHRFDAPLAPVADLVASGEMGRQVMVRAHLECVRPVEYYRDSPWRGSWLHEGGSVLINQAYHVVDLLQWLAGPVTAVSAAFTRQAPPEVMETEDVLAATLTFASGALGTLGVNGAGGSEWGSFIEICGSTGVVAFDIAHPNQVSRLQLKSRRATQHYRRLLADLQDQVASAPPGPRYYGLSHRGQARAFADAVRGMQAPGGATDAVRGIQAPGGATVADALQALHLIRAIYQSAREARQVTLPAPKVVAP